MTQIAIQGIRGSFHDEAAARLVPDAVIVECVTFQDVFDAVTNGETQYGVVAVENSLHGSINPVYRLLERTNVSVLGEVTLGIEQYLIGSQKLAVEDLNTEAAEIRTMFPAFAQCELWLSEHVPLAQKVELFDTAFGVRSVIEEADPLHVAIGGKYAAEMYGGQIIAGPINDDPLNFTRFILLTNEGQVVEDANRTMIILTTGHQEGSLYTALSAFAQRGINLSKLDSHPIPSDTRHYAFYIDIEVGVDSAVAREAFAHLKELGCKVKILGSYKAS